MRRPAISRLVLVIALLAAGLVAGQAARAAEIILYDGRNYGGTSMTLNQSTPDLGNFDNEASSVRVVSGTWILYRNDNYGVTASRPSLTLPPGDYPNLSDAGFPRNRLSSVQLLEDDVAQPPPSTQPPPPPPPIQPGTQPDPRRPVAPTLSWVRLGGFDLDNRAYQTFDRVVTMSTNVSTSANLQGVLLEFRAAEGPPVTNDPAKLQILANARWRTYRRRGSALPRSINFRLSAQSGDKYVYFQLRARLASASGLPRYIVSLPHVDTIQLTPQGDASGMVLHRVPAVQAYDEARARGFTFRAKPGKYGKKNSICEVSVESNALVLTAKKKKLGPSGLLGGGGHCVFTLFGGSRQLTPGWRIERPQVALGPCTRGYPSPWGSRRTRPYGVRIDIRNIDFGYKPNPATTCFVRTWRVSWIQIRGPVGFNWQAAFQR